MDKTKNKNTLLKFVSGLLIPAILFTQLATAPIASAQFGFGSNENEPTKVTSLIAVLVDDGLYEDNQQYSGLIPQYGGELSSLTLRDRINRFAKDVQMADPFTKSIVIRVSANQTPYDISQALETLYFKGDETESEKSQLEGVITVGDVALPVVNKNGYKFISMLPYTDFEDKAYIYNINSRDFEYNTESLSPKPEVWHGVIKASRTGVESTTQLAEYFDKNHLYHSGNTDFTEFDEKVLYADTIWEQNLLDQTVLKRYENYASHLEDFAYYRYTKDLLTELLDDDADLADFVDPALFEDLPDAQSHTIIQSYAVKFHQLFENYLQKANDLIDGTGRWDNWDSIVELISTKDLYSQEYLREVNDKIEAKVDEVVSTLQSPFSFIEDATLTGMVTLDNDNNINTIQQRFINNSKHLEGGFLTIHFNGLAGLEVTDPKECTLYRGNTEFNRVYNPDATDSTGYGGCDASNIDHPERCFPDLAVDPVFDENFGIPVDDVPIEALSYAGCFDFREVTRFDDYIAEATNYLTALANPYLSEAQKDALPLPGSKYRPADEIILFNSPLLTLQDILDMYGGFDGVDNDGDGEIDEQDEYNLEYKIDSNNPYEIGMKILGSNKNEFILENPPFEGIKKVKLDVSHVFSPTLTTIDSITYHKEPTLETIQKHLKEGDIESMPVNDPRFVAFQDMDGEYQEIIYPNSFRKASEEDLTTELENLENYIMNLPGYDPAVVDIEGQLVGIVQDEQDKVADAINWINYTIDQKHAYAIRNYLDGNADAYIGESTNGYEYFYLTAQGSSNKINFALNKEPEITENDSEWNTPEAQLDPALAAEDASNEEAEQNSDVGRNLFEWFAYIVQYLAEVGNSVSNISFQPACGEFPVDEQGQAFQEALKDKNDNGIPDGAEASVGLNIEFENENGLIVTGNTERYAVKISAVNTTGSTNIYDSFTEVKLNLSQEAQKKAQLDGPNTINLINGEAIMYLRATQESGSFVVSAESVNRPNVLTSNILNLRSEARKIKVYTYELQTVEPPTFTEEVLKGYVIKNDNGDTIAEINPDTGKIEIKDEAYEIEVLESEVEKHMRIGVIEKSSGNLVAAVMVIPYEEQLTIQEPDFNFEENALTLDGINVKDLRTEDYVIPFEANDSIYLLDNSGPYTKRIARITNEGQVYVADEHFIIIKNPDKLDEPYIFIIEDGSGNDLVEFYMSYRQGEVNVTTEFPELLAQLINKFSKVAFAQSSRDDDSDGDGLTDLEEVFIGTNRLDKDTDDDGYSDGEEMQSGYDPLKKDERLFSDLDPVQASYNAFTKLLLKGIITRGDNNTIRPNDLITREEYVRMVLGITCVNCSKFSDSAKEKVDTSYIESPFPDRDISEELGYCVKEAKNEGVVSGYASGADAGYFKPQYNISRAEAVKVILEAAGVSSVEYYQADKPWYYRYVLKAQAEKIFPEQTNPSLAPLNTYSKEAFKDWVDYELDSPSNVFENYINSPVTRAEFAVMVQKITEIFDCYQLDQDGDGLPDNIEIYQYNTSTTLADTDQGGLDDLTEVITNKNPLDPSDDAFLDSDGDGIPDIWEDNNGLDKFDYTDANYDFDSDGLINIDEYQNETDPRNPDTDGGGTQDGDEVWLQSTDPLNDSDDTGNPAFDVGIIAIGNNIEQDRVFQITTEGEAEQVINLVDNFIANGMSTLFVAAEILDENGDVLETDNESAIEFFIENTSTTNAELGESKVKVQNGKAINTLTSTNKAGLIDIGAKLVTGSLPSSPHQVFAQPQKPVRMEITPRSNVIKTGGLSKTPLTINLYDINNNIVNNDFFDIDLNISGPGALDLNADIDKNKEGVQLDTYEGTFNIDLFSTEDEGEIEITATLNKDDISLSANATVTSRDDIKIEIIPGKEYIFANGSDTIQLRAQAVDGTGATLTGYNEQIIFKATDESLGAFTTDPTKTLENGQSVITFKSTTKSGIVDVSATATGLDPGQIKFYSVAYQPFEIRLETDNATFNSDGNETVVVTAKIYDMFGNFVEFDNQTPITFRITDETAKYGELTSSASSIVSSGIAQATITGKEISGEIHLVASSPGLSSGTINLYPVTKITSEDLVGEYPDALYGTMLGGAFGNPTEERYAAGEILFKGTVQAVTALTTDASPNMPLATINANGGIEMTNDSQLTSVFNTPNKVLISDPETGQDIAEVTYEYPGGMPINIVDYANTDILQEGIYLLNQTQNEIFKFPELSNAAGITANGNEVLRISGNGKIKVSDNLVELQLSEGDNPFLTLDVLYGGEKISQIIYAKNLNTDAKVNSAPTSQGIFVNSLSDDFIITQTVSGSSTKEPKGVLISDKELKVIGSSAPGFSYTSLEKINDVMGVGFDGDNKHSLFFASGNSVGISNIPYSTDIGINFGDPTVRLGIRNQISSSGYTQTIGEPIYSGDNTIKEMVLSDYNNDNLDDIILAHESGEVRLLQRQLSARPYKDKGLLLDITNGIYSIASADFNNDGYDDLLVATKDPCVGEEVCFYLYENNEGNFTRTNLDLDLEDRVSSIKIGDMNNDDYVDIVLAELSGNIKIYYNNAGEIDPNGQIIENLGMKIDSSSDFKNEVLLHYDGMPQEIEYVTDANGNYVLDSEGNKIDYLDDDFNYENLTFDSGSASNNQFVDPSIQAQAESLGVDPPVFATQEEVPFIYMDADPIFGSEDSTKKAVDINGSTLAMDDKVVYTITLFNISPNEITNLMINDFITESLEYTEGSLECLNCNQPIDITETGMSLRPWVVTIPSIPSGESRLLTYEMTAKQIPEISLDLNINFDASFPKDGYLDISANPENNNSGKNLFLYSVSKNQETGRMIYGRYVSDPATTQEADLPFGIEDANDDGKADVLPDEIKDYAKDLTEGDTDGDGVPNAWDEINGDINNTADEINKIVDTFSCSGGCIPIPINNAFLAPGPINVMGMPVGADPGTPVFVYGPVMIYLSPTLTANLANSVCISGQCWSLIIPLLPPAACEAINEAFENAMSRAGNVTSSSGGTSVLSGSGGSSGSLNPREGNGGLTGSSLLGGYKPSGASNTNKRVPGFPGVITDWFAKQLEEIMVKLSDLPDLYVYYPNPSSLVSELPPTANFKTFSDVLNYVNKLPLIDLEVKNVQMKIPALSATEIPKLQAELQNWLAKAKIQLQQLKLKLQIPCDLKPELKNKCLSAFASIEKPIANVEKNLKLLEEYKKLPAKILEWRTVKTKYIKQIICYLDTITTYMGGYYKKQINKINGWQKVSLNIKNTLKSWQKIIKLQQDYQKSCDSCKTERYGLTQLLAQLFTGAIPQPPVVQFPKWPDFHFDFSHLQLGLKVVLPDIKFKKEQIIMPTLPEFQLPAFPDLPQLPTQPNVALPEEVEEILKQYEENLEIIKKASISISATIPELPELPEFPELPDLPPLPLPQLPDLPDPPKIPEISANIDNALDGLSVAIKIMCLLKKNLLPIPITNLKSHIEAATARSSSVALPIDTLFSFQSPSVNLPSVDKVKLDVKVDLRLETDAIYQSVEKISQAWNNIATDLAKTASEISKEISEIEIPTPEIPSIPEVPEVPQIPNPQVYNPDPIKLIAEQKYINPDSLNSTIEEIKINIASEDLPVEVSSNYLTVLRNALIAYNDSDQLYSQSVNDDYDKLIALADKSPQLNEYIKRRTASVSPISIQSKSEKQSESYAGIKNTARLIAANTNAISPNVVNQEQATSTSGQTELQGLYVYNPATGVNERILMYEGEIGLPNNTIIADIDEDEDEDIIYSYGGNVYLKENFTQPPDSKFVQYNSQNAKIVKIDEFIPEAPSVNNYNITYDTGTEGDFDWQGLNEGSISGYEIVNKDSLADFDSTEYTKSDRVVIIEDIEQVITVGRIKNDLEITAVNGNYTVNGKTTNLYSFGDSIETSSDSSTEIVVSFSDSSQIVLGPNTVIQLPDYTPGDFEVTVISGRAEFRSNFFTNLFLQENSSTINQNAEVKMIYKNGDTVEPLKNSYFYGSTVADGLAYVSYLNGQATLTGMSRQVVNSVSGRQTIQKGQIIHTMDDSRIVIYPESGIQQNLVISKNRTIPISQKYTDDIEIEVISGKVELVNPSDELINQTQIEQGMLVQFNEKIQMQSGNMEVTYANGAKSILGPEDSLQIVELTDPNNPYLNLQSEEGNYYSQIYAIGNNGETGNPTEVTLFAPQVCADDQKPFVEAGPSDKQVIVMQTLRLDASNSFDTDSNIKEFYIDTDVENDTNGDGDPANDNDYMNSIPSHPVFLIGPFDELGSVTYALNAVDQSGNIGKQIINIDVIAPDITLNESSATSEIINGSIDPIAENIPITLVRERDGTATKLADTLTDENGEFRVDGLNYEDAILVKNLDGKVIAEINTYTGRIIILDDNYFVDVYEAVFPSLPTRMVVIEKSTNEIMTTVLLIPDMNTDVTIHSSDFNFEINTIYGFEGTHIKDTNPNDQFEITGLPADDPNFTGGAEIRDTNIDSRISIVDSGGNIYFFDENLDLRIKAVNDPNEPLVIEMLNGTDIISEIFISINNGKQAEIVSRDQINMPEEISTSDLDGDGMSDNFELQYGFDARNPDDAKLDSDSDGLSNLEEFRLGTNPLNPDSDGDGFTDGEEVAWGKDPNKAAGSPFDDVPENHPYYESILNLSQKNILRGEIVDGQFDFNPDMFIARNDFADIILKMLCIIPRPEAYEEPNLYSDMPFDENNYYYPVIKEATLQGFVTGYVGEIDKDSGLNPYKPNATITRAEAVKIVLEALEKQEIITLKDIQPIEDQPWYVPYLSVAVDLSPRLLKESEVKETFILTPEEASEPNKLLTRAEFAAIADRVLQAFDCYIIDSDGDGIPDIWEAQNGLDPNNPNDAGLDNDADGLTNLDEYRFGTDPFDPDTDDGGTYDGIEVERGTNPVDYPADDPFITTGRIEEGGVDPRQNLEEGVYVVERDCNSCPCLSALDHKADLILGDILFAVIANGDLSTVFSKSNELIFKYEK